MDILLQEFQKDLARLGRLLQLIDQVRSYAGLPARVTSGDEFHDHACTLHASASSCHADLVVLAGSTVLYLGGRFEYFVRERFEQLCVAIAAKCKTFKDLPSEMRQNLIGMTAEVMASPRKYGHGEKGVESFIGNLATNLKATTGLADINSRCLSITYENMRSTTLKELFERIAAKEVWTMVSEQATVKAHFETLQSTDAKNKVTKYLDEFMDIRNTIAHPSANVQWPDVTKVQEYIGYFEVVSSALAEVIGVYERTLPMTRNVGSAASTPALATVASPARPPASPSSPAPSDAQQQAAPPAPMPAEPKPPDSDAGTPPLAPSG